MTTSEILAIVNKVRSIGTIGIACEEGILQRVPFEGYSIILYRENKRLGFRVSKDVTESELIDLLIKNVSEL